MTNEEIEKAIEFIVEQEARTSAKIDMVSDKLDALTEKVDSLTDVQTRSTESITALLAIAQVHEREIMANAQHISSVSRDVAALGEITRATDERLNALINVVERHISNNNGQRQ